MDEFIKWCNTNQGFMLILLTAVYVIATVFIWRANHKSASAMKETLEQNSLIQYQNVKIQLFNERFNLYNKVKDILYNNYSGVTKPIEYFGLLLDENYMHDYNITFLKVKFLYSEQSYQNLLRIQGVINDLRYKNDILKRISDYMNVNNLKLYMAINQFKNDYQNKLLTTDKEERFKNLCQKNLFNLSIEEKNYNYYILFKDIESQEKLYNDERKAFLEQLEAGLKIN